MMVEERTSHRFINVETKIKNARLGDDSAWHEAQSVLINSLEDYPEKYTPHLGLIKEVFSLRRRAFLEVISNEQASRGVQELVSGVEGGAQDLLTEPLVLIRDLFARPRPLKGSRRHH